MTNRLLSILGSALLALALTPPCSARGMTGMGGTTGSHGHMGGNRGFQSIGGFFSYFPYYSPYDYGDYSPSYTPAPPPQAQANFTNPAAAQAAYAGAEYDNALNDYVATVQHARDEFHNSPDYQSARRQVADASQFDDAASESATAQVRRDPAYRALVEHRTEIEIALKSAPLHSGLRNVLATEKLNDNAQLNAMSATALAGNPTFQEAKTRLAAAHQALSQLEQRFESTLVTRPDVASARRVLETARLNRAAAQGMLATPYDRSDGTW